MVDRAERKRLRREKQAEKSKRLSPASVPIEPRNDAQRELLSALQSHDQTVTLGPAGTGKTYVPTAYAINQLMSGEVDQIVLIKPATTSGEDHGFLPGDVNEKMAPFVASFMDVLNDRMTRSGAEKAIREGKVVIEPIAYLRGRTLSNAFILVDEAQNATLSQLKLILTRVGDGSQLVIGGDTSQSDLKPGQSGLQNIVDMIDDQDLDVPIIEFDEEDVVRSHICRVWTEAFRRFEAAR